MKKALWCVLETASGPLRVFVRRKIKGGLYGCYSAKKARIDIALGNKGVMKMTLFHELLHAALGLYSEDVKAALFGSGKMHREELVVGAIEVPLFDILTRNGLLSIPAPPKLPKGKRKL